MNTFGVPREPEWIELPDKVGLLVDLDCPLGDFDGVAAYFAKMDATVVMERGQVVSAGDQTAARIEELVAYARRAVRDWRNVDYPDGEPVPFSADNVERLFREVGGMAAGYASMTSIARMRRDAPKNASAPSPAGTSTATGAANPDPTSATPAATSRSPAPSSGGDAPTSTRSRGRRRRPPSGASSATVAA